MKKIIFLFLLAVVSLIKAQETLTKVTKATTVFDDSKLNSDSIPDVYAISGNFKNILVLRLKYQTDLLTGLEKMAKQNNIRNAVILSAIGSVRSYHYHTISNRTFPSKNIFVKDPTTPADITNMNGYIIDGRVHAHITFSNADKAFGGHLEPGTEIFTFAIVTLGILSDDINLNRIDDKTYR